MSDYLSEHPEIFMARKEMHFFGRDLHFADHFYRRSQEAYLAEFAGAEGRLCGEASVWYLYSQTAAAEIKAFNPAARILILLREPTQMMYSLFHYFRYDGNEPLASFAEALSAQPDRQAGRRLGRQTYLAAGLLYWNTAHFAEQVQRYFEAFGRDQVKVILQEDLAANPGEVYRETLEFLEVDATYFVPEFRIVNAGQTVRNRLAQAVLNDPAIRLAALAVRPWLPRQVFQGLHRIERALQHLNSSMKKAAPMEPELAQHLRREFAPEVTQLGELIGRNLAHWTQGAGAGRWLAGGAKGSQTTQSE
jgi:hypothetical protein